MAEMLGFCPVISRSGPEKPLHGTKYRSQSPWNRPIWGAAREFDFRDEFAADSPLQRRVCKLSVPERRTHRLENSGAYATERGMPDMAFSLYSSPGARPSHFRSVRTVVRTQPAARSPSALDGAGDHPSLLVDLRRRRSCLGA